MPNFLKDDILHLIPRIQSIAKINARLHKYPSEFIRVLYIHIAKEFSEDMELVEYMMMNLDEDILVEMYNDLEFFDKQYLEELYKDLQNH